MSIQFGERAQALADMRAHRLFCVVGAPFEYGCGDDSMVGVGQPDPLGVVEGGEQQPVDRYRKAREELRDVGVA